MGAEVNQQRSDVVRRLLIGITVCAVILVIGFFAVVSTRWGHGLDNDAYFGRDASGRVVVKLDGEILDHVTKATLLVLLAAIFLVAYVRKIPVIGGFAVAGVVCAVAGAEVLKKILPWHVLIESDSLLGRGLQTETYPSGHATIGSSLALAALMVSPARWRSWGSIAAGLVMAGFATGVVFSGWHRPSDAVAGVCWAGVVMGLTAVVAITVRTPEVSSVGSAAERRRQRRDSIIGSTIAAVIVYSLIVLAAVFANSGLPDADRAFVIFAGIIVAAAFTVSNWFGNGLSAVNWRQANDRT